MDLLKKFDIDSVCSIFKRIIVKEYCEEYLKKIFKILNYEYENQNIFPIKENVFNAFKYVDFNEIKVVIIGQDPYHGENQAHGLSFSVNKECKIPSSLKNIFIELNRDLEIPIPKHGNLTSWANQGVLLLNSCLTVRKASPNSHKDIGWEIFTDKIIRTLSLYRKNLVFILWGNFAIRKERLIDSSKHLIIKSAHPSGLSAHRGFFFSKPFSRTNDYLKENLIEEINWEIL